MKKTIFALLLISLFSCSGIKSYYKIEAFKAQKITSKNIDKLLRMTGSNKNFLIVNKGGFIVWDDKGAWMFVNEIDFKRNYSKKVKGLWNTEKSTFYQSF